MRSRHCRTAAAEGLINGALPLVSFVGNENSPFIRRLFAEPFLDAFGASPERHINRIGCREHCFAKTMPVDGAVDHGNAVTGNYLSLEHIHSVDLARAILTVLR